MALLVPSASAQSDDPQADGSSWEASVSDDGRYIAFRSGATNLVPGDTNGVTDVFVRDRNNGVTQRVSDHFFVAPMGSRAPTTMVT